MSGEAGGRVGRTLSVVTGLYAGAPEALWPGKPQSAIAKRPVVGRAQLSPEGLDVDAQADRRVHGGVDKALHHYPADHYPVWAEESPDRAERFRAGGFGENISTMGLTERDLCLGDVIAIGDAEVEVSHGRRPCWKLNAHLEQPDLAARMQKNGRTGWYYRVRRPGEIGVGDALILKGRPQPDWPLARVIGALFNPRLTREEAAAAAALPELAEAWRKDFRRIADAPD
ncbi:MAG: MOSC domain-containing protein [Pseudomonadota bacterium]